MKRPGKKTVKRLQTLLLAFVMIFTLLPDFPERAAAAGIVRREAAVEKLLAAVTGDTAEARVKALNRLLTEQNEYNTTAALTEEEEFPLPYADVPVGEWYYDAVAYAHHNGLMNGMGNSLFQPQGLVTREQIWMVLARLMGETPANMEQARQWAMDRGIVAGVTADTLCPTDNATRAQFATILQRYILVR